MLNRKHRIDSPPCSLRSHADRNAKFVEKVSGQKLNYEIGPRRPGDIVAIYANNDKAKNLLGWDPKYSLEDMMSTAWKWEQKLKKDEELFTSAKSGLN